MFGVYGCVMRAIGNGKHLDDAGGLVYDEARPDLGWQPIATALVGPPPVAGTTAPPPGVAAPAVAHEGDAVVQARVSGWASTVSGVLGQANYERLGRSLTGAWFLLLLSFVAGGFLFDPGLGLVNACIAGHGDCDPAATSILDAPDVDVPLVDTTDTTPSTTADTTTSTTSTAPPSSTTPSTFEVAPLDDEQGARQLAPALPDPAQEQALAVLPETGASPALVLGGVGLITTGTALALWSQT